jgi:hypothetical protein
LEHRIFECDFSALESSKSVTLKARGRNLCQLAEVLTRRPYRTQFDAYEAFRHELLTKDRVVVIRKLSASKVGPDKPGKARSLNKILDDAHKTGTTSPVLRVLTDLVGREEKPLLRVLDLCSGRLAIGAPKVTVNALNQYTGRLLY